MDEVEKRPEGVGWSVHEEYTMSKINQNPVFLRIHNLMQDRRITGKELSERLGLASCTFSQWKRDENRKGYLIHINEIADILGTSPTYLIWGVEDEELTKLTPQETDVVRLIRRIDARKIKCVKDMMEIFAAI